MRTCLLLSAGVLLASAGPARPAPPADSIVKVLASVRYPNPIRPWTQSKAQEVAATGVVIAGNKVLTNAHVVLYATEVHVQARPGADKIEARVESIGPDVDLAVLTVSEKTFFAKKPPLPRAKKLPSARDTVEVYGFPVGGAELSVTKGVVSRIAYGSYYGGNVGQIIQVSAAVNPGNSGGPALVGGMMVGLVFSRLREAENIGYVIPNEEIDLFLEDVKDGRYDGKPFDATWTQYQRLENEGLRRMLELDKSTRGVLALLPRKPLPGSPYQEFDVLTRIGAHDIDNEGMVRLPGGLRIPFNGLIPRLVKKGAVPITVLRQGKRLELSLPVTTQDHRLVREFQGEQLSYFIHGPLVFSPAREEAIRWYVQYGNATLGRSPLLARRGDRVRFPGEELVVVTSRLFDHKIAKGYNDPFGQVLESVNGHKIRNLRHLVEVLRDSRDPFLTFRFAEEGAEVLVFDRKKLNAATEEVLEEAGIAPTRRGSKDMLAVWKKKSPLERLPAPSKDK
jgi:S1-C subfamily serine protease